MRMTFLFLSACLLVSLGCDIDNVTGLDTEILTVNVTTTGTNLDADGYRLAITAEPNEPIGVNESKSFTVLLTNLTVELQDIAANCAANANLQRVRMNGSATVSFFVQCT